MELSKVDSNLLQLSDILPLIHHYQPTTTSSATTNTQQQLRILNLHSNHIKSIDAKVTKFLPHLTILDLSSNDIERIDGLELLQSLKSLNLSNNKIRQITGLSALTKLQRLYLSYNLIEKLAGLVHLHGNHHKLELIDLRGNEIKDIKEIYYLVGLTKLKHLILNDEIKDISKEIDTSITRINPICKDPTYRAQIWSICPQISSLDCTDAGGRKIKLDDAAFQFSELTSDLSNFLSESFTVSSQIPHPSLQPNQPNFDNSIYQTYTPQQTQNQYLQSDRLTRIEEEIKSLAVTLSTQRHQQNPSTQAMQNATSTSNEKDSAIIVGPNESIQLNMLQEQMRQLLQMQSEIMKLRKQNGETEKVFGKGVKNDEEIESDETNEVKTMSNTSIDGERRSCRSSRKKAESANQAFR
ncbi:hypothetical protein BKA69DRAFT_749151 [Paraphysoderma sedebokerense]|nr:hypothetical protein BKA69DRAFT_749151 [Paraphysoderma sedebokerense]